MYVMACWVANIFTHLGVSLFGYKFEVPVNFVVTVFKLQSYATALFGQHLYTVQTPPWRFLFCRQNLKSVPQV